MLGWNTLPCPIFQTPGGWIKLEDYIQAREYKVEQVFIILAGQYLLRTRWNRIHSVEILMDYRLVHQGLYTLAERQASAAGLRWLSSRGPRLLLLAGCIRHCDSTLRSQFIPRSVLRVIVFVLPPHAYCPLSSTTERCTMLLGVACI